MLTSTVSYKLALRLKKENIPLPLIPARVYVKPRGGKVALMNNLTGVTPNDGSCDDKEFTYCAAPTYAELLDALAGSLGTGYGFSRSEDGRWSFATPTQNPYKFRRNSSADACSCLEKGIGRMLDTLKENNHD